MSDDIKLLTVEQINALPEAAGWWPMGLNDRIFRLVRAVERAAVLANREARGEPVAWMHAKYDHCVSVDPTAYANARPLYAAPQPAIPPGWKLVPVKLLEALEWYQPTYNGSPSCPCCGNQQHWGHEEGCELAAMLAAASHPQEKL